ncbi:hypothetical protein F4819DRAFT_507654 [Hypoxylon fuscum]|nr:hypothetical protein F4819DRAFT_507654 [Hypoxylon fuscum]
MECDQSKLIDQGVPLSTGIVIWVFFGIALYNNIEIFILIFTMFQRRNTLYFWSMLISNIGISIHEIYATLQLFNLAPDLPKALIASLAWLIMTTGQSIVLYSRLHLVMDNRRKLRWVLLMIAISFITLQLPTTTVFIGMQTTPANKRSAFSNAFNVLKVIQLVVFTIQEALLSGLYVYAFRKTSQPMRMSKERKVRNLLRQMIGLFIVVVSLDFGLIVAELMELFQVQTTLKPVIYSIKLKVELLVLDNLANLVQSSSCYS